MRLIIIILVAIIILGGLIIAKSMNLNIKEGSDVKILARETFKWLGSIGKNLKSLVGLTVSQEWLPNVNKTNKTNQTG